MRRVWGEGVPLHGWVSLTLPCPVPPALCPCVDTQVVTPSSTDRVGECRPEALLGVDKMRVMGTESELEPAGVETKG